MAEAINAQRRLPAFKWTFVQPLLRVVAESAWITVLYAALTVVLSKHVPLLGPIEFTGFVAFGVVVGWLGRPRAALGPALVIIAMIGGGALGWMASADARALLPDLARAADRHVFGWLAGLAVLRGVVVNIGPRAADELEGMVKVVPAALAVIWAYVTLAAQPALWLPFAVNAMWGTVAFLAAAVVSIGMARLDFLHTGIVDARQRRGWRWLIVAVGLCVVPIALPVAVLSGIPLSALLTPIAGPIQWLLGLVAIPLSWIIWLLSEILRPIAGPLGQFLDEMSARTRDLGQPNSPESSVAASLIAAAIVIVTIAFILLVIFLVARWLLTRNSGVDDELDAATSDTERTIEVPPREPKSRETRSRVRRWGAPSDVVSAYMSALVELQGHLDLARLPNETPAQHASRLRHLNVVVGGDVARLAAGYQLARYGERRITPPENLRAVGRFKRLRSALRASTP